MGRWWRPFYILSVRNSGKIKSLGVSEEGQALPFVWVASGAGGVVGRLHHNQGSWPRSAQAMQRAHCTASQAAFRGAATGPLSGARSDAERHRASETPTEINALLPPRRPVMFCAAHTSPRCSSPLPSALKGDSSNIGTNRQAAPCFPTALFQRQPVLRRLTATQPSCTKVTQPCPALRQPGIFVCTQAPPVGVQTPPPTLETTNSPLQNTLRARQQEEPPTPSHGKELFLGNADMSSPTRPLRSAPPPYLEGPVETFDFCFLLDHFAEDF